MKKFLSYLFYTLFIVVLIYWGFEHIQYLSTQARRTFDQFPLYAFMALYPIAVGAITGIPHLVSHINQEGKWSVDWYRVLGIGAPTLCINFSILFSSTFVSKYLSKWYNLTNDWYKFISDKQVLTLSGFILGYILLTSLQRLSENNHKKS
ncbi:hypothetical protein REC12_19220 [Desulfosporosinus sp. PR]|uniref:hypothetical protein n=1 Tax=Candidatus Desulfosporosinus nitrosoreducens TaxID=3401928 RepID=UPI0027E98F50|nr:hypothetical protein [Desulfosporosinus sp. PR]MDQ7095725.1 hypothetical protein [Desulfosporosinus sp. PR]